MSDDREREHCERVAREFLRANELPSAEPVVPFLVAYTMRERAAARTDLPRALAVIEAADRIVAIASRLEMSEDELDEALAAYRKARHG